MNERTASPAAAPYPSHWHIAAIDFSAADSLSRELAVPRPIAELLVGYGLLDCAAARAFLQPDLKQLHDPRLMLGMQTAVDRLRCALLAHEPILIYGDYDVDGTVATVLLKTALERAAVSLGVIADVRFHIPHRIREGYGMQESRIETAAAEGVRLVVSVDTGIRAFAVAQQAQRLGIDLIVTDHHLLEARGQVPAAVAVLNPSQPNCGYPSKDLCGAGVAFKLAQALLESAAASEGERQRLREKTLPSFLKLLAIATIADAVPLTRENRIIAALGLQELRKPAQAGLRKLMELAQIDTTRAISASDVGFRLAPRINAAGRMDVASDVVEMFLARDAAVACTLAEKLHRLNEERRAAEKEALCAIEAQIESLSQAADALPACLLLDDAGRGDGSAWHRGVIGILAARVVDRTGRPALVVTHEDGEAYGSGRSVRGFHLLDTLTALHAEVDGETLFSRFGGHAHAVGFSLPSARVDELRARLLRLAGTQPPAPRATLECNAVLRLGEITPEFLTALEQLGPFGYGNAEPLFVTSNVRLCTPVRVIQERHMRLNLEEPESRVRFSGMLWSRQHDWTAQSHQEHWSEGDLFTIAYRLRRNWHPDFGGWELEILDLQRSQVSGDPDLGET